VEKIGDVINSGDSVKARVIKIDKSERRVGLSIKAANYDADQLAAEAAAYESQTTDNLTNLGDILDEATRDE
jgi:small subunit ribosomal protein S1